MPARQPASRPFVNIRVHSWFQNQTNPSLTPASLKTQGRKAYSTTQNHPDAAMTAHRPPPSSATRRRCRVRVGIKFKQNDRKNGRTRPRFQLVDLMFAQGAFSHFPCLQRIGFSFKQFHHQALL